MATTGFLPPAAGGHAHRMLLRQCRHRRTGRGNSSANGASPVPSFMAAVGWPRCSFCAPRATDGLAEHARYRKGPAPFFTSSPGGYVVGAYAMEAFGVGPTRVRTGAFLRDHVRARGRRW